MRYTPEERLEIGRRIYENEINRYQAAIEYGISEACARNYMRAYRDTNGMPGKNRCGGIRRDEEQPQPISIRADNSTSQPVLVLKENVFLLIFLI